MATGKIKQSDPDKRFRRVLAASSLTGDKVRNRAGEDLGKVDEIMLDLHNGHVAYVVVSYGGVLGMGNKLFAVPWNAFTIDEDEKTFVLDIQKERLENAPGFDKDNWPDMADQTWASGVYKYYGTRPDWDEETSDYENERTFRGGGSV
jgi:sporulation protein YlmC with PRC-barrel domain